MRLLLSIGLVLGVAIGSSYALAQNVVFDVFIRYLALDSDEDGTFSWIYTSTTDPTGVAGQEGDIVFVPDGEIGRQVYATGGGGANDWEVLHTMRATAEAVNIASTGDGSPATLTFTPTQYRYYEFNCADPDTCDITLGETNVLEGYKLVIANIGTNVVDWSDTSGVSELAGAFAMDNDDTLTLLYAGDRWVEIVRSVN